MIINLLQDLSFIFSLFILKKTTFHFLHSRKVLFAPFSLHTAREEELEAGSVEVSRHQRQRCLHAREVRDAARKTHNEGIKAM
jgi:hypothetical protein